MASHIVNVSLNVTVGDDKEGRPHIGIFWIADGMIHSSYLGTFPTKSAVIGGTKAGGLAAIMLGEAMKDAGEEPA